MMSRKNAVIVALILVSITGRAAPLKLDERASGAGEWGYHPADRAVSAVNPPAFGQICWYAWVQRYLQSFPNRLQPNNRIR